MSFRSSQRRSAVSRALLAFTVLLLLAALNPAAGSAQSCTNCTLYARTELNLRQGPSLDAAVLRFIPAGAPVQRTTGAETNGYAPVTYDNVPGYAVALGLVASPAEVDPVITPAAPVETAPVETPPAETAPVDSAPAATASAETAPAAAGDLRVTLAPLWLRSGPALDAEPILGIPEGELVTLTGEVLGGDYVTVDYGGVTGWVHAELLARQDELG